MRPARSKNRLWVIMLLATVITSAAAARDSLEDGQRGKESVDATLTIQLVKTGLYLISGGGGNSLLRLSANGLILVDGKLPDKYRALMAQIRKISKLSDMPVRVLIVTNHHQDRTGNIGRFLAAGIPVVAQENVKRNLAACNSSEGMGEPPSFMYDRDYTLRLGGVEVRLLHLGNAYTSGDTVVYFPNLKAVAVGSLFSPDTPEPDFLAGGSLVDWRRVLSQILNLDFDVVVPSTGSVVTRADLEAFKTKIDIVVSRAIALVERGVAKDQLMDQLETKDLGWRFNFSGDRLDRFYAELSQLR